MSSTIATIPMPALSGVLITTGLGMLNQSEFKHCSAVQKSDVWSPSWPRLVAGSVWGWPEGIWDRVDDGCGDECLPNHARKDIP